MQLRTVLTLIFGVITTSAASAANPASRGVCYDSAVSMAKAMTFAAFDHQAQSPLIEYEGADEKAHYIITVTSRPFKWGDGVARPIELKYRVTFDNDSPARCSLVEASIDNL